MNQDFTTVSSRIEHVRTLLNISKGDFSLFLGFKNQSGYSQFIRRGRISEIHLQRLKTLKNVNPDFIKTGQLPIIFQNKSKNFEIDVNNLKRFEVQVQKSEGLQGSKLLICIEYD